MTRILLTIAALVAFAGSASAVEGETYETEMPKLAAQMVERCHALPGYASPPCIATLEGAWAHLTNTLTGQEFNSLNLWTTQLMCALAIDGHDAIPPKDKAGSIIVCIARDYAGNLPTAKRTEAAMAEIEAEK